MMALTIKQRGAIMWALIGLFYRGYCRARLIEMRRFRLATAA